MHLLPFIRHTNRGISFAEMLLVVVLVAALARGAILNLSPARPWVLDSAAADVVSALRFARLEAGRARTPTVVAIDPVGKTVSVSRLDFSTGTAVLQAVRHPLHKHNYQVRLDRFTGGAGIGVQSVFSFSDGTTSSTVGFLPGGEPGKLTSATTVQPLKDPYRWRGAWQGAMLYRSGELVAYGSGDYVAVLEHTSGGDFEADLALGKWTRDDLATPQITLMAGPHSRRIHVAPITGLVRVQ